MRKYWLGVVALWLTAGCAHEGQLRPLPGAIPLTEDSTAAVTGEKGVRLVAYGSNWKGQPQNLENVITPLEILLENHSGRPLAIHYDGFELEGRKQYVAQNPKDLGRLARQDLVAQPPQDSYGYRSPPPTAYLDKYVPASRGGVAYDMTYSSYNGTRPYTPPPCLTCSTGAEAAALPTRDMLHVALPEGTLEDGQSRQGFLYFAEPLRREDTVTLRVKLVDATTGELFGTLRVPFAVD